MSSNLVRGPTFGLYGTRTFCVYYVAIPLRVVTISGKVNWQAGIPIYLSEHYSPVQHRRVSLPLASSRYFRYLQQIFVDTMKVLGSLGANNCFRHTEFLKLTSVSLNIFSPKPWKKPHGRWNLGHSFSIFKNAIGASKHNGPGSTLENFHWSKMTVDRLLFY